MTKGDGLTNGSSPFNLSLSSYGEGSNRVLHVCSRVALVASGMRQKAQPTEPSIASFIPPLVIEPGPDPPAKYIPPAPRRSVKP